MTVADVMPWLNLLLVPMSWHVIRTEARITRMEALVTLLLERNK